MIGTDCGHPGWAATCSASPAVRQCRKHRAARAQARNEGTPRRGCQLGATHVSLRAVRTDGPPSHAAVAGHVAGV